MIDNPGFTVSRDFDSWDDASQPRRPMFSHRTKQRMLREKCRARREGRLYREGPNGYVILGKAG